MPSPLSSESVRELSGNGSSSERIRSSNGNPLKIFCQSLASDAWEEVKQRSNQFYFNCYKTAESIAAVESHQLERLRQQILEIISRHKKRIWRKGDIFVCDTSTKPVVFVVVRIDTGAPGTHVDILLSQEQVGFVKELTVAVNVKNEINKRALRKESESDTRNRSFFGETLLKKVWQSLTYHVDEDHNVMDDALHNTYQNSGHHALINQGTYQPFISALQNKMRKRVCLVYPGMVVRMKGGRMGLITSCRVENELLRKPSLTCQDVVVSLDVEDPGEFERIHISPFIDTVPEVYELELFAGCLKPYFLKHTLKRFREGDSFTSEAVQFKILAGRAWGDEVRGHMGRYRVGPSTSIYVGRAIYPHWIDILPVAQRDILQGMPRHSQTLALMRMIGDAPVADIERIMHSLEMVSGIREYGDGRLNNGTSAPLLVDVEQYGVNRFKEQFESETTFCIVCLNDVSKDNDELVKLPCKHIFHLKCVLHWFSRSVTCPLCKDDLTVQP